MVANLLSECRITGILGPKTCNFRFSPPNTFVYVGLYPFLDGQERHNTGLFGNRFLPNNLNQSFRPIVKIRTWLFQNYVFEKKYLLLGLCRSKIRLHFLCSLILICTVRKKAIPVGLAT